MSTPTKAALERMLLEQKIRHESALADIADISARRERDIERDRAWKTGNIRHLYLFQEFSAETCSRWMDALDHWARRDPGEPITIDINSPGGSVHHGLALYDTVCRMRRQGHHVTTRATGMAASMAAIMLQAGDVREIDRNATLLIHEGFTVIVGALTPGDQDDLKELNVRNERRLVDILAERSTMSATQIRNKMKRRDWWLDSTEALKAGFVDVIV